MLSSGSTEVTPPIVPITNNFPEEVRVASGGALNEDGDAIYKMYAGMDVIQERIYVSWRDCTGHDPFDGTVEMAYSDDDGVTWLGTQLVYDPVHIYTDDPSILIGDPDALLDARDTRLMLSPDGTHLLLLCFVAIGKNDAGTNTGRNYIDGDWVRNMCISFPIINGNELDYANKNIAYISEGVEAFSGGYVILPSGEMFVSCYSGQITIPTNYSYKSSDNGYTWTSFGLVYTDPNYANEATYVMFGQSIIGAGRHAVNRLAKSDDYGVTWIYSDSPPYLSTGQNAVLLEDGMIGLFGRYFPSTYVFDPSNLTYIENTEFDWETSGYGTILRYKDKYIVAYYTTNHIKFKQLKYSTVTNKFSNNLVDAPVNTSRFQTPTIANVNGLNITLASYMISYDDLTTLSNLTYRVYNNGVLFATFGSSNLDENVSIPLRYVNLIMTIEYDTNYLFSISSVDDDGAESPITAEVAYNLPTP